MPSFAHRIIQIAGLAFIIFMAMGGGLVERQNLADGAVRTAMRTVYWGLPPAPVGPSYCDVLEFGSQALVLPCDFKPPVIGWLEGGKY